LLSTDAAYVAPASSAFDKLDIIGLSTPLDEVNARVGRVVRDGSTNNIFVGFTVLAVEDVGNSVVGPFLVRVDDSIPFGAIEHSGVEELSFLVFS